MAQWFIPCSPDIYDAEAAFEEYGHVVWHQECNMSAGDIAYIYVSSPVKAICCKCVIEEVNIPFDVGEDDGYVLDETFCSKQHRRYMDLRLLEDYDDPMLGYAMLKMNGLTSPIRSQRRVPDQVAKYIATVTSGSSTKGIG